MEKKSFTREEFYELVWSKPAIKLAPELGVSDAAITKICRRYRIPKPGVGDWNLMAAGHKVSKPKLPPLKDGEQNQIVIWTTEKRDRPSPPPLPEDLLQLIENEELSENRIVVDTQQAITHAALRRSQQLLKKADTDFFGRLAVSTHKQGRLPIGLAISVDSLHRSLQILDALFKAVAQRGHTVKTIDDFVYVIINGERISIYLKERTTQKIVRDHDGSQYSYKPNGKLELSLSSAAESTRHTWKDKPNLPLEDQLNDILIGMLTHAALAPSSRAASLERERKQEQQRRDAQLRAREEERRRYVFSKRKQNLEHEVEAWTKCRDIGLFLVQCEKRLKENGKLDPTSVDGRWLEWSKKYADSLDPTKNGRLQAIISQFDEPRYY